MGRRELWHTTEAWRHIPVKYYTFCAEPAISKNSLPTKESASQGTGRAKGKKAQP